MGKGWIKLKIEGLSEEGDGISHWKGKRVYVPYTLPQEEVVVRIKRRGRNFMEGELLDVLKPSKIRVKPPCPIFKECGLCKWQMIPYENQLSFKESLLKQVIEKEGTLKDLPLEPIVAMERPWNYLNRVFYRVKRVRMGKVILGYEREGRIVEVMECPIQLRIFDPFIKPLRELLEREPITIYNKKAKRGKLLGITLRGSEKLGEVLIVMSTRLKAISSSLAEKILSLSTTQIVGVVESTKVKEGKALNTISKAIRGRDYYIEDLAKVRVRVSASSIFYENPLQTRRIIERIEDYVERCDHLLDLSCGVGTFALSLSKRCRRVTGIEKDISSYYDALENVKVNEAWNVDFLEGDPLSILAEFKDPDKIIVEDERLINRTFLRSLVETKPNLLITVFHKPSTLAKSVSKLTQIGYSLKNVIPFDTYPHTPSCTFVAILRLL
jgi:23S rRNA (uracil1939-C5)-methyltransferase